MIHRMSAGGPAVLIYCTGITSFFEIALEVAPS